MEKNKGNEDVFSLLDILVIIAKNRKLIILTTLIPFVFILFLSILSSILPANSFLNFFPNIYKPEVIVLLKKPGENQSGFSSLLNNNELGSLVGILDGNNVGMGSSDLGELVKVLLKTNVIRDTIIEKYNFKDKYNVSKFVSSECRKKFDKNLLIDVDYESNTIHIAYIDTDPNFATNVLNSTVVELEKKVKQLYLEQTDEKKSFLDDQIKVKGAELNKLQNDMIEYQKKYGIIDVSTQAQKSVSFVAELEADIITKELNLKALEKNSPYDKTSIEFLKSEITLTQRLVDELKKGGGDYSRTFIPLDNLPELTKQYMNISKDLTIQSLILEMLKQQYEAVKIEESDKSQIFNILEEAEVPERKNSPNRTLILIIVVFTAFVISIIIAFVKEYFTNLKNDSKEYEKLIFIKNHLFKTKKIKI